MEFSDDIELLGLELFDAAFPVALGDDDDVKRRFMTLFVQTGSGRRGGSAEILRASNMIGETFAVKRMHQAKTADGRPIGGSPSIGRQKVLRASFDSRSGGSGNTGTPDYVTAGHIAAFYEEFRMHCLVSNLQGFPRVYGFGLAAGNPVIVMEWIEGSTLRDAMRAYRSADAGANGTARNASLLPLTTVADLGIAVLDALERASALDAALIHRDLSPRNIMLRSRKTSPDEQLHTGRFDLCLIDFGTAQLDANTAADAYADPDFTRQAGIWRMGTPDYAPPEMLSADIDLPEGYRRSQTIDTYALCSVLYELYAGRKPYRLSPADTESPYRVKTAHAPEPLEPRSPDGGALGAAIMTGLSAQQADRPGIAQLKAALENWKRLPGQTRIGELSGAKPAKAAFWQPGYAQRLVTRRRFIAAGILAAGGAIAAAIVATHPQPRKRAADPARYATATAPYSGAPLFKALDGNLPGWMLCTTAGDIACKPDSSRECGALREGLAALYDDISALWGYIVPDSAHTGESADTGRADSAGNADYAWAILPSFAQAGDFSEGFAAVQDPETLLWGYANAQGDWAIEPRFAAASSFSNGFAAVREKPAGSASGESPLRWGAIDAQGRCVIEPAFSALGSFSVDGFSVAQDESGSWGIVDATGAWASAARFPLARRFACGMAPAKDAQSGLWGFIGTDGAWVLEPSFRDARAFYDDLAAVQDVASQLWYLIETDGSAAHGMKPRFWKLGDLHDGLAPAQASAEDSTVVFDDRDPDARAEFAGMRYGYIDSSGEWQMKRLTTLVDTAIGVPEI